MPATLLPNDPIAVARKIASEDARWIADIFLSAVHVDEGVIPLLFIGHAGRIVYEGSELARSRTSAVADPVLAAQLPSKHKKTLDRIRHAAKLFDDTPPGYTGHRYTELLTHMDGYLAHARKEFGSEDAGIYGCGTRLVAVTPALTYRMGQGPKTSSEKLGRKMQSATPTYGRAIRVLSTSDGVAHALTATIPFEQVVISGGDWRSAQYLPARFDPTYSEALKLVLLHVEGELNTLRFIVPVTTAGHEDAAFRATVVGVYHGLRTLEHAEKEQPAPASRQANRMRALLGSPEWQRLSSSTHGRHVRNRAMHYEITNKLTGLDPSLPMNGIIEALPNGRPHADYAADLAAVLTEASDLLHDWRR